MVFSHVAGSKQLQVHFKAQEYESTQNDKLLRNVVSTLQPSTSPLSFFFLLPPLLHFPNAFSSLIFGKKVSTTPFNFWAVEARHTHSDPVTTLLSYARQN